MRPSCAVTKAPVIRNVKKATIQKVKTDGPANCTPAELLMNSTIATKTTTRSNGPSVLETRTGAIFSEIIVSCWSACAAMRPPLTVGRRASQGRAHPTRSRRQESCTRTSTAV
jgi:hypothetical protein